jgi:Domain of unknown function (DUF5063)
VNESIAKFVAAANNFCSLVEDASEADPHVFAVACLGTLVRLFDRALALPLVEPVAPDHSTQITHDDLADIWRDLKEGLDVLTNRTASAEVDAIWHWRFSFESHWGRHARSAITALDDLRPKPATE